MRLDLAIIDARSEVKVERHGSGTAKQDSVRQFQSPTRGGDLLEVCELVADGLDNQLIRAALGVAVSLLAELRDWKIGGRFVHWHSINSIVGKSL
jgi:hypothetical protein